MNCSQVQRRLHQIGVAEFGVIECHGHGVCRRPHYRAEDCIFFPDEQQEHDTNSDGNHRRVELSLWLHVAGARAHRRTVGKARRRKPERSRALWRTLSELADALPYRQAAAAAASAAAAGALYMGDWNAAEFCTWACAQTASPTHTCECFKPTATTAGTRTACSASGPSAHHSKSERWAAADA
eukprot:109579-Chlamydomonas_euryale.AAC.1